MLTLPPLMQAQIDGIYFVVDFICYFDVHAKSRS